VHFAEGQDVKKGSCSSRIDPRPFEAALAQAQAVLARDTATRRTPSAAGARYEDLYKRG
jgi:multidrug efflux system membrane fusion protein